MSDRTKLLKGTRKTPVRKFPAWCRRDVEEAIERLLAVLDAADPDPDLEANGDAEPSLAGYPHDCGGDLEFDPSEDEHSLGSLDRRIDQTGWAQGLGGDYEQEHDGREPSLGSVNFAGPQLMMIKGLGVVLEGGDQTDWGRTRANDDRECDPAEDGFGDMDGLIEQTGGAE
jgi:hypothetical protein